MNSYSLKLTRLDPWPFEDQPHTFFMPTTIPDIVAKAKENWGGGSYRIAVIDNLTGECIKSKTFEISGLPKCKPAPVDTSQDDHDCWVCHKPGCKGCPKEVHVFEHRITFEYAKAQRSCMNAHTIESGDEHLAVYTNYVRNNYCKKCAVKFLKKNSKALHDITNGAVERFGDGVL